MQERRDILNKMSIQLETLYGLSCDLKNAKVLTEDEFEEYFKDVIEIMEDRIEGVRNRIECEHNDISVVSADGSYGCGVIEVTWKCNDCDTVMEGQLNMEELWRYDTTAKEIQMNFEKVKQ